MGRPTELRARTFQLDGGLYLVLSFRIPDAAAAHVLTAAESEVASAVLRGASNQQIARARGRSVNTVAKQVASVFRKLGVRSRLELAERLWNHPGSAAWSG